MDTDDEFCLKWNNHHSTFLTVLHSLLKKEVLVDVTLAAEGKFIEAHRLVLSTCSEYFQDALKIHQNKHAFIFLNNVAFDDLKALIDYMYVGEVNISQEQLPRFLATAEALRIKGLSDRVEQSPSIVEQDCMPTQTKVKNNSRKIAKSSSQTTTLLSPPAVVRQTRHSSQQQLIVPNNHFATPQLQVTSSGVQNSRNTSDDASETGLTTEMNFVAVNSNSEELDHLEETNAAGDGLGTLGKVWSMNQDDEDGDWENTVDLLGVEGESSTKLDEDTECNAVTPSESDNSIDYRQYTESLPNVNSALPEELMPNPSSSAHSSKNKWTSSLSAIGSSNLPAVRALRKAGGSNHVPDFLESSVAKVTCPNCGRGYSQRGSLNRHLKFECGIVPKFPCQLCPMRFRRAYKLTEHHNRVHANASTTLNLS